MHPDDVRDGPTTSALRVEHERARQGWETPLAFWLGERRVEVVEVLDRWLSPDHHDFKVRGKDGIYILRHALCDGHWELLLFDSNLREETRLSST